MKILLTQKNLCLCVYQRISLTTEPIWFSFTVKLLINPGKVYIYVFWGGIPAPFQEKSPKKRHIIAI